MSTPVFDMSLKGRLGGHSFKARRNGLIERIRRSHPMLAALRSKKSDRVKKRIWLNLTKHANLRANAAELERDELLMALFEIANAPRDWTVNDVERMAGIARAALDKVKGAAA